MSAFSWWSAGLWVAQAFLAFMYLFAGFMKLSRSPDGLSKMGWTWAQTMPVAFIKLLGVVELLGALGIVLPVAMDILPVLTPIAALCLTALQISAIILHSVRQETAKTLPLNLVLLAASLFVWWGRS